MRDKILASKEFKQNHRMGMELHGDGTVCSSSSVMVGGAVGVGGGKTEMEGGGEMNRITSKFKGEKAGSSNNVVPIFHHYYFQYQLYYIF